ncbi:MAG TPA: efflux RND transporter periplasmic adaptor subunit, partial [Terracidiphilus sp.]|nr:efflux RND transporter periplasmic adaptor subunit [Terracidiphilus sp.]
MTQERKQTVRLWFWRGSAVFLIVVFFTVRALTKDRLQVRVAEATHMQLVSTVSTNGRVEPEVKYELHSPIATIVKEVYVQPGDTVAAGKLLMVLDDLQVRAREASAESGVKAALAGLEAALHNGTQQEQQMAAADGTRARLERDEARRSLETLTKLNQTGAASSSEVAAARQR